MKSGLYNIEIAAEFGETTEMTEGFLTGNGGLVFVKLQPVEEAHGRWIDRPDLRRLLSIPEAYVCSECGKSAIERHNFCNRCGAKMDLEEPHG